MNPEFDMMLAQVAEDVFSLMAFIMPAEEEEPAAGDGRGRLVARIAFSGPLDGSLVLSVSAGVPAAVATNMLGLDNPDSISPQQCRDALQELANVICGNLLPRIAGSRDVFHVFPPCILSEDQLAEAAGRDPQAKVKLRLDCGWAELALFVGSPGKTGGSARSCAAGRCESPAGTTRNSS
jgi:CheY-specific phosphatase CheX